jgi:hypothetical protein
MQSTRQINQSRHLKFKDFELTFFFPIRHQRNILETRTYKVNITKNTPGNNRPKIWTAGEPYKTIQSVV